MKFVLPVAVGVLALVLGVLLGAQTVRYEFVKMGGGYPARFDRWTGKLELIVISATDQFTQSLPAPTPTPWGDGDEAVAPSKR